jgi:HK97 family phage portal protein
MGLFTRNEARDFVGITGAEDLIPGRAGGSRQVGSQLVTDDRAMRHSVVWACLRLRAGLISTFPVDVYRDVLGTQTEYPSKPPILTDPGGVRMDMIDFMAATQIDLDRAGNAVGLIVERNTVRTPLYPDGLPHRIELQPASACAYVRKPGEPDRWRIGGTLYHLDDVWHERGNVVPGLPVGLSTLNYAALSIGESLSMQQFGLDWFGGGGVPKGKMRNTAKKLETAGIAQAKQWYADVVTNGDLLVMGNDWEYEMIQAQTAGIEFIEGRRLSAVDICRFLDTPADMVDANPGGGASITYANITQRNLDYLIHHLGPTVIRRENTLSKLLPRPRYVKLNTSALLRMDDATRQDVLRSRVESWFLTNTEARELENRAPLSAEQLAEMRDLYGSPKIGGTGGGQTAATDEGAPAPAGAAA